MGDLSVLREGWAYAEEMRTARLRAMTIAEGVAEWLALAGDFETHLVATESQFREPRLQALQTLQERLRRLGRARPSDG